MFYRAQVIVIIMVLTLASIFEQPALYIDTNTSVLRRIISKLNILKMYHPFHLASSMVSKIQMKNWKFCNDMLYYLSALLIMHR